MEFDEGEEATRDDDDEDYAETSHKLKYYTKISWKIHQN